MFGLSVKVPEPFGNSFLVNIHTFIVSCSLYFNDTRRNIFHYPCSITGSPLCLCLMNAIGKLRTKDTVIFEEQGFWILTD